MTVFSGSSVARSPEGMHDLFQAVLSCHKLFCPHFYFPSFYSCPALLPVSLQHFFIAVLLERYLLSPCPRITASFLSFPLPALFDGVSYISVLHLLSKTSFCPDISLTHTSSDLLQCWKQTKTGLSSLRSFSLLSFLFAPSHFLPLPVSLSPFSLQAHHSTWPSFDLLSVFELPVLLIFQSPISTLWKLRSEISLVQLPCCWVKPNITYIRNFLSYLAG